MAREALVWAHARIGFPAAVEAAGGDPDAALRSAGLVRADLEDPERYIPVRQALAIPVAGAEATGDPFFGLHWGVNDRAEHLGALAYVVTNSPTVRVALDNLTRYISIVSQGVDLWTNERGERTSLCFRVRDPELTRVRQNNDYAVGLGLNLLRRVLGPEWVPESVLFSHSAPADVSEYERVFRAPLHFEQDYNALVFATEVLERPIESADEDLLLVLEHHAGDLLRKSPPLEHIATSARQAIRRAVVEGEPKLERIAEMLHMSSRTLQRELSNAGVTFQALVDEGRRLVALEHLEAGRSITEVAYLTGYSEVSAFVRAFRRWTGEPPSRYVRARRSEE